MPRFIQRIKVLPRRKRILVITGLAIIVVAIKCLIILGLFILFVRSIGNTFNCDYFPIDNSELIAQIDVPDTDEYTCDYFEDGSKKIKNVLFVISKDVARTRYFSFSNFRRVTPQDTLIFKYQPQWTQLVDSIRHHKVLYVNHNTYVSDKKNHYEWLYVVDSVKGTTWSEIIKTPPQ